MAAPKFATRHFDDAQAALSYVQHLYDSQIQYLREALKRFVAGEDVKHHVRAKYPFVRIHTDTVAHADSRLSFGFVAGPGIYETTLTRPDLYADYYREQFELLVEDLIKSTLREPVIFDGRNLYDPVMLKHSGIRYYAIGRGEVPADI